MKIVTRFLAVLGLATLSVGCASLPPPSAHALAARQALMACRFEQPGRGDRLSRGGRSDPAIAACLARKGV
jgi:hypothetical protein